MVVEGNVESRTSLRNPLEELDKPSTEYTLKESDLRNTLEEPDIRSTLEESDLRNTLEEPDRQSTEIHSRSRTESNGREGDGGM